MANILPNMNKAEIDARAEAKRVLLLDFLASGECWTTAPIAGVLMQTSGRSALSTLQSLERAMLIKKEDGQRGFVPALFGITNHGLGMARNPHPQAREFQIGRTNPSFVRHHVQTQQARLQAEGEGWTSWVPGKVLYGPDVKKRTGTKIPDGLVTRPDGKRAAIEIENYVKSKKRMEEIIGQYLQQLNAGEIDLVCYITPHPTGMQRALDAVTFVAIGSNKIKLTDAHRQRFQVFSNEDFPKKGASK